jgi:Transposase DDE domain
VFKDIAARGKTSVDWFFGLKLHLVVNDKGELLTWKVTPGNVDDRQPVPELVQHLFGKVFADKGYISQKMFKELLENVGVQVVTKLKRNMKQRLMPFGDRLPCAKTCCCWDSYWSIEKYFPDWAFPASFSSQLLCQYSVRVDCLLPSTEEARNCYGRQFAVFCLTRTDVS